MNMKLLAKALVASLLVTGVSGAQAQTKPLVAANPANSTKAGVDAWQQGDYVKAVGIWRPLANAGEADAQFNLGQAYKLGRGVPVDLPIALEWYRKASAQGHVRAENNYGLLLFQQNRRDEAMPYIHKASERGEPRAMYLLGTALYNGDLVPRDWVKAYALMTRASGAGLPQASASLATMDQYIPEAQRKQGLALATQMDQSAKATSIATAQPAPVAKPAPPVRVAPAPIRTTDLPPSVPAAAPVAKPRPAPAPAPKPARAGDWRIQLGAFSDDARARSLWSAVSAKVSGLSAYQPYLVKGAGVTRLQAGPLASEADAAKLCRAVKAAGADCLTKHL
jgi:uncharacterized protein